MTDFFLGEIRLFPYLRVPKDWHICDGTSLPVASNQALYALIGNSFGGNNVNFNLPKMNGATVMGYGSIDPNIPAGPIGKAGGTENVTLSAAQTPMHNHAMMAASTPGTAPPINGYFAQPTVQSQVPSPQPAPPPVYAAAVPDTALNAFAITSTGGNGAHENRQPYLPLVYAICVSGIFPMRN